jgi:hypothetical protein
MDMDTRALTSAVEEALMQLGNRLELEEVERALTSAVEEALMQLGNRLELEEVENLAHLHILHMLSEKIKDLLANQEEFSRSQMMICSPFGMTGFQSILVAPVLLSEARRRGSAIAAVEWLQKVLNTQRASGILVITCWGITPEVPVTLPGNVQLLPFESLPASRQKDALSKPHCPSLTMPPLTWKSPTAAVVCTTAIEPFLKDANDDTPMQNATDYSPLLSDVLLCLGTSAEAGIMPGPRWFQYTDPDLECAQTGSPTIFVHQEITPLALEGNGNLDVSRASELISNFLNLNSSHKNKARIAMQRLAQARIRRMPADRALELAIALEALLVGDHGELTFKIGLRAALLTSTNPDERRRVRAIIKALYNIRSSLVNTGSSRDTFTVSGIGKMSTSDIVAEAMGITTSVVQILVNNGMNPDWDSIELSITT